MMKKSFALLRGEIRAELTGPETERFLSACSASDAVIWDLKSSDAFSLELSFYEKDLERMEKTAEMLNCTLRRIGSRGGSTSARTVRRRALPLAAAMLLAVLLCVSSLFVWDIEVVGNSAVSDAEILRALEQSGVGVGCFWPGTDAERIRTDFLLRERRIAWMSLNVSGSRATVCVLERTEKPVIYDRGAAADLIAAKDGIIFDMSVENGRALVSRGDAVAKGDTLVSGSMGGREVRSAGSVTADTWTERVIYTAPGALKKERKASFPFCLAIKAGKRRINIFKYSSKDIDECDKITREYAIGIKGLFRFPVSFVVERRLPYTTAGAYQAESGEFERRALETLAESIDGRVVSCSFGRGDGCIVMYAHCAENIAATKDYTLGEDR